MKRTALSLLVILTVAVVSLTGCAGSLEKRVDTLGRSLESLKVAHEETAKLAVSTSFNVDQMKDKVDETNRMVAQIGDQINFIPSEATEAAYANSASADSAIDRPATSPSEVKTKADSGTSGTVESRLATLTKRVSNHEERLVAVEKKVEPWPNLYAYVKDLNARFNKCRLTDGSAERAYIVGPFDKNKFGLNKKLTRQLREARDDIKKRSSTVSRISSFASQDGPKDYNKTLSEARAKTIADYLKKEGLEVPKDEILGLGETTEFGDKLDNRCAVIFTIPASE